MVLAPLPLEELVAGVQIQTEHPAVPLSEDVSGVGYDVFGAEADVYLGVDRFLLGRCSLRSGQVLQIGGLESELEVKDLVGVGCNWASENDAAATFF